MRGVAVAAALIIAVLVGAGAGYLFGNSNVRTATSITTSTLHETTTTWNKVTSPALELIARVTPSSVTRGQSVSITFGAYNPLPITFAINVTSYTNQYLGGCPFSGWPTTFYVYGGHLTFSNYSHYSPLLLWNDSIIIPCPVSFSSTLVFHPNSDEVTVHTFTPVPDYAVNSTSNYSGFWVHGPGTGDSFKTFAPGDYTVLFNDTSGQQELHYFAVNP